MFEKNFPKWMNCQEKEKEIKVDLTKLRCKLKVLYFQNPFYVHFNLRNLHKLVFTHEHLFTCFLVETSP